MLPTSLMQSCKRVFRKRRHQSVKIGPETSDVTITPPFRRIKKKAGPLGRGRLAFIQEK